MENRKTAEGDPEPDEMQSRKPTETREGAAALITPVKSSELMNGRQEILIEHETTIYRLRKTRQGKLILTK